MTVRQTLKETVVTQNGAGLCVIFLHQGSDMALYLQLANGERDAKPLPFKLVPDVGAHSVVDLVDSGVITHVKLDLVNDGVLAEIDQKDFYRRMSQDSVGARSRAGQHVLYQIGRYPILKPDTDTHSVDFSRIMKIDDRLFN